MSRRQCTCKGCGNKFTPGTFAPDFRCPECLDRDYTEAQQRRDAEQRTSVSYTSVPLSGPYSLSQSLQLTKSQMADLASQISAASASVKDMKVLTPEPPPLPVRSSSVRFTRDDECLWVECFADGSARTVCPVEDGMTWDDIAERVENHIAEHGC